MQLWIRKICLALAILVITAHNVLIHHHDQILFTANHELNDHDHDHDHEEHGLFALNFIDHYFTSQSTDNLVNQSSFILQDTLLPEMVSLPEATWCPVLKTSYQQKQEFPPPQHRYSFSALRAPPTISI